MGDDNVDSNYNDNVQTNEVNEAAEKEFSIVEKDFDTAETNVDKSVVTD